MIKINAGIYVIETLKEISEITENCCLIYCKEDKKLYFKTDDEKTISIQGII